MNQIGGFGAIAIVGDAFHDLRVEITSVVEIILHLFSRIDSRLIVIILRLFGQMLVHPMPKAFLMVLGDIIEPSGEPVRKLDLMGTLDDIVGDFRFGEVRFLVTRDGDGVFLQEILSFRDKTADGTRCQQGERKARNDDM